MASFIVRIVLHSKPPEHADYDKLHDAMEDTGFSRQIDNDEDGVWYHLPPAEYIIEGSYTLPQVCNKAKAAAKSVDPKYGILTAEVTNYRWIGLEPV